MPTILIAATTVDKLDHGYWTTLNGTLSFVPLGKSGVIIQGDQYTITIVKNGTIQVKNKHGLVFNLPTQSFFDCFFGPDRPRTVSNFLLQIDQTIQRPIDFDDL